MAKKKPENDKPGDRDRDRLNRIARERRQTVQEIGPLPPVADPERRELCAFDLLLFLETYLARRYFWPWADHHRRPSPRCSGACSTAVVPPGVPAGDGKTTLSKGAPGRPERLAKYALLIAANRSPWSRRSGLKQSGNQRPAGRGLPLACCRSKAGSPAGRAGARLAVN